MIFLDILNITLGDSESYLNPMDSVDISVLAVNQPSWVQSSISKQLSVACGFKVSSVFKSFAVLFKSIPDVPHPGPNLGLECSLFCSSDPKSVYVAQGHTQE